MAISGTANSDVDTIAKNLGLARTGTGSATSVAGALGFTYKAKTVTGADHTGQVLRLTIANQEGVCVIDWGDGTTTQVPASTGSTIDHDYGGSAGSKTWDFTASGFHKRSSTTLA